MNALHFSIDIKAPKEKVWEVMLGDKTYREWTAAFQEGSFYEGSWDKGSAIRFLSMDDGKPSGMSSKIAENRPYEFLSIEHVGEIVGGREDTSSDRARQWAGAHENYSFSESDGVTTISVDLEGANVSPEMATMFEQMWPPALQKLKEIAER